MIVILLYFIYKFTITMKLKHAVTSSLLLLLVASHRLTIGHKDEDEADNEIAAMIEEAEKDLSTEQQKALEVDDKAGSVQDSAPSQYSSVV
jgi:hypothetical protein